MTATMVHAISVAIWKTPRSSWPQGRAGLRRRRHEPGASQVRRARRQGGALAPGQLGELLSGPEQIEDDGQRPRIGTLMRLPRASRPAVCHGLRVSGRGQGTGEGRCYTRAFPG